MGFFYPFIEVMFWGDGWLKLNENANVYTRILTRKNTWKTLDNMYALCSKRRHGDDNRIKYAFWTVENGRHFHKEQTAVLELCVRLRNRKSRSTTIFRKWKIEKLWVFSPWTRCVSTSDAFWSTCGVGIIYTGRKKVLELCVRLWWTAHSFTSLAKRGRCEKLRLHKKRTGDSNV